MDIQDFNVEQNLTVKDFGSMPPVGPTVNEKSASSVAATLSILHGGDPVEYQNDKRDILDPTRREDFLKKQSLIRDKIWEDTKKALPSLLADPSESDATKVSAASTITVTKLPKVNTVQTLAEEALVADSGVNETERASESRTSMASEVGAIVAQKRRLTERINSLGLREDASIEKSVKDLAEFFAPLAEWIHYTDLLSEVNPDESSFNFMGEQKKKLYDAIEKIPVADRELFANKIIDIIEANDTILLPDGNDIAALQDLHRMLVDDDYSNTERFFDDVTSVLDVLGVGSIAKFIKGSFKAGKTAKTINEINKVNEVNKTISLEEEAQNFLQASKEAKPQTSLEAEANSFVGSKEPTVDEVFPKPKKNTEKSLLEEAKNFKSEPEPTADSVFREALSEKTRTDVLPSTPSQTVKDFNPDLARELHKLAAEDETGEAAKALYGSSKTEAMAKDLLPEPEIVKGKMPNKVEMSSPEFVEPEALYKARTSSGNLIYTNKDLRTIKEKFISGLENVEGMTLHPSSLMVRTNLDGTIGFTARYSPMDSGFKTSTDAINHARFAFRHYGLQAENFSILERRGDAWVEISAKDAKSKEILGLSVDKNVLPESLKSKEYAIGMKYDYRVSPEDWTEAEVLTTAPGLIPRMVQFLDRVPIQFMSKLGQGSLVQHILDAASVIHPQILGAASVATDKVYGLKKLFLETFDEFQKIYDKLPKDRRAILTDYIHEANRDGLKLNEASLYARGMNETEVEALKTWRRANDTMWYAANDDMVLTLRAKGFQAFVHDATGTKLYGRPVSARTAYSEKFVYDPVANKVVKLDKAQIDELYEKGGTAFQIGEPTKIDGHWVDTVISRNTPDSGYMRKIYDGEKVLAYRDGYYPVAYDALFFITKKVKKTGGQESYKVIATARDSVERDSVLSMLRHDDPKSEFSFKLDRSLTQRSSKIFDEGQWNMSSSSGTTSQRIRGERLADGGVDLQKTGHAHLKDPMQAVQDQIHQLSQRVAVRPFMDAAKKRWMLNYGPYVNLKRNEVTGRIEFPTSITEIVGKPGAPGKIVADARTNFNYLYSFENGYINLIDETYKGLVQAASQLFGEAGMTSLERVGYKASKTPPVQLVKTTAFKLFIAASPFRQGFVQRAQMLLLGAVNPTYTGKTLLKDLWNIDMVRLGISKDPKYVALFEEVKNAGVLEAVDAHVLIRDTMLDMANASVTKKALNVLDKPFRFGQKIGFDAAEQDVLLSSWLAHRDLAIKAGKNIKDQRVLDEVMAQARAFTGQMNRAGDMPYSHNSLAAVAQFFSFKHKMLLQGVTNRSLKAKDRLKFLAYTTALFGIDASPLAAIYALLPKGEETEVEKKLKDGLLDIALNEALTLASGEDQAIDWGDLAPTEAYGIGNVFVSMLDAPISSILVGGPSSSLLYGGNPRLTDAFKTAMKYFNIADDYEDEKLDTSFTDVLKASLSTMSGFSSFFKAQYAMKTGQKLSSSGKVTDDEVTGIEAFMTSLGFRTKTESGYQDVREIQFGDQTFTNDDVDLWYAELKRHLARRGDTVKEDDFSLRVLQEAWRVFGDDRPRVIEIIKKKLERDAQNGDFVVFKGILNKMGLIPEDETWELINAMPEGRAKEVLTETMNTRKDQQDGN